MITHQQLKESFDYDQETGILYRRFKKGTKQVGCKNNDGYLVVQFKYQYYAVHRLIWLLITGQNPKHEIDHINGVRDDNRSVNLRSVTRTQNMRNRSVNASSSSGVMGVYWYKNLNKWQSKIKVNKRTIHLGYFTDIKDAVTARREAEAKYGFHANHGRTA
jgi:hypothetical protein